MRTGPEPSYDPRPKVVVSILLTFAAVSLAALTIEFAAAALPVLTESPRGIHDIRQAADAAFVRGEFAYAALLYRQIVVTMDFPPFLLIREGCARAKAGQVDRALEAAQLAVWGEPRISLSLALRCLSERDRTLVSWATPSRTLIYARSVRLRQTAAGVAASGLDLPRTRELIACINFVSGAHRLAIQQWLLRGGGSPEPSRECARTV
jgi:hypothetical protein